MWLDSISQSYGTIEAMRIVLPKSLVSLIANKFFLENSHPRRQTSLETSYGQDFPSHNAIGRFSNGEVPSDILGTYADHVPCSLKPAVADRLQPAG
jgi:hypothetical protein